MRKVNLKTYNGKPGSVEVLHRADSGQQPVDCWRNYDRNCNNDCAAFRVQDGHVYCLALPNAFVPAFAIGELVEEDGGE